MRRLPEMFAYGSVEAREPSSIGMWHDYTTSTADCDGWSDSGIIDAAYSFAHQQDGHFVGPEPEAIHGLCAVSPFVCVEQ